MRNIFSALIVGGLLAASGSAHAVGREDNGYRQIMAGQGIVAEQMLVQQHRQFPEDPSVTLNLAAIYASTNRPDAARQMYDAVLSRPDEELDMANDRTGWAHSVARLGLQRLAATQVSAR